MSLASLLIVVAAQIALFQLGSIAFTRSVFAMHFGETTGPPTDAVRRYLLRNRQMQVGCAALFALLLLAAAIAPEGDHERGILAASASLGSSLVFAITFMHARRRLRLLGESLPDRGLRRASLESRGIRRLYAPLWESVPLCVLVGTAVFTAWALYGLPAGERPTIGSPTAVQLLVYLVIQGVVTAVGSWLALRMSSARSAASSRFPLFRDHPETALKLGVDLADAEMKAFLMARLGIAGLFATQQLHLFFRATGHSAAAIAGFAKSGCIALLFVVFAHYLFRVSRLVRQARASTGAAPDPRT